MIRHDVCLKGWSELGSKRAIIIKGILLMKPSHWWLSSLEDRRLCCKFYFSFKFLSPRFLIEFATSFFKMFHSSSASSVDDTLVHLLYFLKKRYHQDFPLPTWTWNTLCFSIDIWVMARVFPLSTWACNTLNTLTLSVSVAVSRLSSTTW